MGAHVGSIGGVFSGDDSALASVGRVFPPTPDNLRRWVKNAQDVKAGVLMPSFTNLSETDLSDLAIYLEGLT